MSKEIYLEEFTEIYLEIQQNINSDYLNKENTHTHKT